MAWFRIASIADTGTFFDFRFGEGSANGDFCGYFDTGQTLIELANTAYSYTTGTTITTNTWYHVTFLRTSISDAYMYLNGVLDISDTGDDQTGRAANTLMGGGRAFLSWNNPLNGRVAYIKAGSAA